MQVPFKPRDSVIICNRQNNDILVTPKPVDLTNTKKLIKIGNKDLSIYPSRIQKIKAQDYAETCFDVSKDIFENNRPKTIFIDGIPEVKGNGDFEEPEANAGYPYYSDDDSVNTNKPKKVSTPKNKQSKDWKNTSTNKRRNSLNPSLPSLKLDDYGINQDGGTPLYLLCGELLPFLHSKSSLSDDITSYASKDFEILVVTYETILDQQRVSSYSRNFNYRSVKGYMNKIVRALEVYYFSKSIIEYYKKFPLDNMGMRHLALKLDSMFIIRLEQLESLLKLHYLHPSLVKYIKDMYCNFSTNGAKSSPIIKLCVKNIVLDDVNNNIKLNYDYLESLIKEFSKLTEMGGFFRVLCPNWKINLPPITAGKVYNADFLSFWHNSNICYLPDRSKENLANSNIIANESSEIYLGSFSQEFKGEYLMAISVYDSSKKIVNPGYFKPFSDFGDHIDAKK
jgi:hypothetical protein